MKHILNLSYMHLPLHLQACFLYLGMYPENHIIPRDDLVKQWIVEGFVSSLHGLDLMGVGRSYFNELVDRNMIQPSKNQYGEVLSCTVHDMMLDLILRKCIEDNFISVAYSSEDMGTLLHDCKYKVNRLSLRSMAISGAIYDTDIAASMSQVRSFILFENPISPLSWFKYLRMVIIFDSGNKIVDLTAISQLFQLTYLMVKVRGQIELPNELGELVYLETLDIANCKLIKSIPSDIVHLPRLSYLALPDFTDLPEGIENMKSMRTLHGFDLKKSSLKCVMGLGELANLRELSMKTHHYFRTSKLDALACSIGKLRNLEHLCISGYHFEDKKNQQLGSLSNPFQHIERLGLRFWELCRVPEWMSGLHCLRFLELVVDKTSTEEVHLLGELPCLAHLDFGVSEFLDERAILGAGLFPVLEFFYFHSRKDTTLGFEPGAMPNLRTLWLDAYGWCGTIPVGMEHLLHLQEIKVYGTSSFMKSAFKEALLVHPNRPCVN
uniref:Disease resistance protein RPM1 n=1 Tax=Triticum urartu TaxID=4572 RepID=A0A8R7VBV4_TRIUA